MKLSQLPLKEIKSRLESGGLVLRMGAFSFCVTTPIASIAKSFSVLYGDYEVCSHDYADFHVSVDYSSIKNRFFRQVRFFFDGFPPFNSFPSQHAPAIIEWGMNWCVSNHINTHLIIHAAVIEKQGFAAVMPAPPGSGKSTLTAALIQEGWRLLSDELTLIDVQTLLVSPFPRPVSLKNQSIDIIKQNYPQVAFGPLSTDTSKGTVCHIRPPSLCVERQFESCPVGWVVFPKYEKDAETELVEKNKAQTFMDIADNSFNYSRLGRAGFDVLSKVIDGADCFQFRYSRLDEAIQVFERLGMAK